MTVRNKVLVLNAGSSSLKFKLYEMLGEQGAGAGRKLRWAAVSFCRQKLGAQASLARLGPKLPWPSKCCSNTKQL